MTAVTKTAYTTKREAAEARWKKAYDAYMAAFERWELSTADSPDDKRLESELKQASLELSKATRKSP